jgi:hypothetical protein
MSLRAPAWAPGDQTRRPSLKPRQQRRQAARRVPVEQRAPWEQQGKQKQQQPARAERVEREQQQAEAARAERVAQQPASSSSEQPASAGSRPVGVPHSAEMPCKGCQVAASSAVTKSDG